MSCSSNCLSCCNPENDFNYEDDLTHILIFGITGMTGGAVGEGAIGSSWYRVSGFTRRDSGEVYDEIKAKGINLLTGDMLNYETVEAAMKDVDVVFLNTFYWDLMDPIAELKQGTNVVDAAMKCGVKHLIYAGTDYNVLTAQVRCPYLEGKAMVADYIVSVGIPYTIIRMGFFFENFISVFRPHPVSQSQEKYAITLPLHNVPINCGSIEDYGQCIARVGLRAGKYAYSILHLSSEYLTVTNMVQSFNNHFHVGARFIDGKVPIKAFKNFNFRGSQELTALFSHYRTQLEWDSSTLKGLYSHTQTLDVWVQKNEKIIQLILDDVIQEVYTKGQSPSSSSYQGVRVLDKIKQFTQGMLGSGSKRKSKKVVIMTGASTDKPRTRGNPIVDRVGTFLGLIKESQL